MHLHIINVFGNDAIFLGGSLSDEDIRPKRFPLLVSEVHCRPPDVSSVLPPRQLRLQALLGHFLLGLSGALYGLRSTESLRLTAAELNSICQASLAGGAAQRS